MQLENRSSLPVQVTVTTSVPKTQNFNGEIPPGDTHIFALSTDFAYTVVGSAISQSPATRSGITANATVTFTLVNGVLEIGIS